MGKIHTILSMYDHQICAPLEMDLRGVIDLELHDTIQVLDLFLIIGL